MIREARITKLRAMLKARTDHDGKPLPNYADNVSALRDAIAKHEARLT